MQAVLLSDRIRITKCLRKRYIVLEESTVQYFPAKLVASGDVEKTSHVFGISVRQHGLLTGYVLLELLNLICTRSKDTLLPASISALAALHDIGKMNPEFLRKLLCQIEDDPCVDHWRELLSHFEEIPEVPHPLVSSAVLEALGAPNYCCEVVAEHHGYSKGLVYPNSSEVLGGSSWATVRENLGKYLLSYFSTDGAFPRCIRSRKVKPVQIELWKGLIVLSDWIASRQSTPILEGGEQEVAHKLVKEAGFRKLSVDEDKTFQDCFLFQPRPAQSLLLDAYVGPGVYVLEAPTGCGKTEAALGLAFKAIQNGDASGIYFALPTQLTSDRAHERIEAAVEHFLGRHHDVRLAHGTAFLKRIKLGKEAEAGELWYTSSRLALLAPFGVGTVDQALLALINSKFHQVRLAGLCGKVVILDEVHSYDAYTTELITRLVRTLESMGAIVVLLSATLTHGTLQHIVGEEDDVPPSSGTTSLTVKTVAGISKKELPVLDSRFVTLNLLEDTRATEIALTEAIRCARSGMQVLWIENTVHEAQKVFKKLQAQGVTTGLVHSRFRRKDRDSHEQYWTTAFGKKGASERSSMGRILVGTQVLEQSLDLDADFLVTRLAPMDLLIQRFGRLWRHQETVRPEACQAAVALVLASPEEKSTLITRTGLEQPFGSTGRIYHPYTLFRTLEVLKHRLNSSAVLTLPQDVRELLISALEPREERQVELIPYKEEMMAIKSEQLDKALGTLSVSHQTDESFGTRLMTYEEFEVLILFEEDRSVFTACESKEDVNLAIEERLLRSPRKVGKADIEVLLPWISVELKTWMKKAKRFSSLNVCFCMSDGRLSEGEGGVNINSVTYDKLTGLSFVD